MISHPVCGRRWRVVDRAALIRVWINNASKYLSRDVSPSSPPPREGWLKHEESKPTRVISPRVTINNACDTQQWPTERCTKRDSGKFVPVPIVEEGDSSPARRGWWMKMCMHLREIYKARMPVTGRAVNEPVRQWRKRSISFRGSNFQIVNFYVPNSTSSPILLCNTQNSVELNLRTKRIEISSWEKNFSRKS